MRQAKLVLSSRCKSGPSQGVASAWYRVLRGHWRQWLRSVHSNCIGCEIEPRKIDIAGAESLYSLEGNMCGTAMRGADALPGSKATSRQKDRTGTWEVSWLAAVMSVGAGCGGPHREGEEP